VPIETGPTHGTQPPRRSITGPQRLLRHQGGRQLAPLTPDASMALGRGPSFLSNPSLIFRVDLAATSTSPYVLAANFGTDE